MKLKHSLLILLIMCLVLGCIYVQKNIHEKQYYIFIYTSANKETGYKNIDILENVMVKLNLKKRIIEKRDNSIHIALSKNDLSKLTKSSAFHKKDYDYYSIGTYDLKSKTLHKFKSDIPSPADAMMINFSYIFF